MVYCSVSCVSNTNQLKVTGFEPMTLCTQNRCATRLRYTLHATSSTYGVGVLQAHKCLNPHSSLTGPRRRLNFSLEWAAHQRSPRGAQLLCSRLCLCACM